MTTIPNLSQWSREWIAKLDLGIEELQHDSKQTPANTTINNHRIEILNKLIGIIEAK